MSEGEHRVALSPQLVHLSWLYSTAYLKVKIQRFRHGFKRRFLTSGCLLTLTLTLTLYLTLYLTLTLTLSLIL